MAIKEITLQQMTEQGFLPEECRVLISRDESMSLLTGNIRNAKRGCFLDSDVLQFLPIQRPGRKLAASAFLGTARMEDREIICREWIAEGGNSIRWNANGTVIAETEDENVRLEAVRNIRMLLCAEYRFFISKKDHNHGKHVEIKEIRSTPDEYERFRGYKCGNRVAYKGMLLPESENACRFFGLSRAARMLLGDVVLLGSDFSLTDADDLWNRTIHVITAEDAVNDNDMPPAGEKVHVPSSLERWGTLTRVLEGDAVLRFFRRDRVSGTRPEANDNTVYELCRIHVGKDRVRTYISNGSFWAEETGQFPASAVLGYPVYFSRNSDYSSLVRGTRLEYAGSLVGTPQYYTEDIYWLLGVLYNEKFEKLAKIGAVFRKTCGWRHTDYDDFLHCQFGILGSGNPYQIAGMNRHQLDLIKSCVRRHEYVLSYTGNGMRSGIHREPEKGLFRIFKEILYTDPEHRPFGGPETYMNVAACSDKASDAVMRLLDAYLDYQNPLLIEDLSDLMHDVITRYSLDALLRWEEGLSAIIRSNPYHNEHVFWVIKSNLRDYDEIRESMELPLTGPRFTSYAELRNAHDAVAELAACSETRDFYEGFRRHYTNWKQYEFSDEKLCIVAPKDPKEIVHEGIALNHCVKGFVPSIARGKTSVVFVRKAEDLETPFFTAEISSSGLLVQVHGFGNRNINTEPGLDSFIRKWCKARKLEMGNVNGLYGAG